MAPPFSLRQFPEWSATMPPIHRIPAARPFPFRLLAFLAWWLAMGTIVAACFGLAFAYYAVASFLPGNWLGATRLGRRSGGGG